MDIQYVLLEILLIVITPASTNLVPSLRMIIITPPKKYQQEGYDNPNSVSIVYQSIRWGMISSTNKMFIPTGKRFSIIPNRSKNRRFSSFRPSTELCFAHSFSSLPARGPKMSQNVPGSTCMANGECVFIWICLRFEGMFLHDFACAVSHGFYHLYGLACRCFIHPILKASPRAMSSQK